MAERRIAPDPEHAPQHAPGRLRLAGQRLAAFGARTRNIPIEPRSAVPRPAPATVHEAEYESVLVTFDESGYSPEVMGTAARMAARRRRGIHVLVTITVPASRPIDAPMPEQEAQAESILEEAKLQVRSRVTGHWEKVRAGQTGRRIIDEARELGAAAIVMAMPSGSDGFSHAQKLVLRERPCRVIIETIPARQPTHRRRRQSAAERERQPANR
jgi:APA family basic amino acid/polyamine antiporter